MISLLLPTRKRPQGLRTSINSVLSNSSGQHKIEILLGVDDDDQETLDYLASPEFAGLQAQYPHGVVRHFVFKRKGYLNLHEYLNELAPHSKEDLVFFWNDDAIILTPNWDLEIAPHRNYPGCIRIQCANHQHPNALFPILHKSWIKTFGKISPVTHADTWIRFVMQNSIIPDGYLNVNVFSFHARADITSYNEDSTFQEQDYSLDGVNPSDPRDYSNPDRRAELPVYIQKVKELLDDYRRS
jgi:hypothetical protein